jgi:transposase
LIEQACTRPGWLLLWEDECWFSRLAQPNLRSWASPEEPLRLVERERQKDDPEPKALSCFGAVREDTGQMYLYFHDGQPNSGQTKTMLQWLLERARQEGKRVAVVIWDQASWHKSKETRQWVQEYNRQAKQKGDVRLLLWQLPAKSPWLNPIEPRWVHAKKAVVEPSGPLTAVELKRRVSTHFRTEPYMPTSKESSVEMH